MEDIILDFTDKDTAYCSVWQFNYGQTIELIAADIDTSMTVQWHYNGIIGIDSRAITTAGGKFYSVVPNNALLQEDKVYGYVHHIDDDEGYTMYAIELTVRQRSPLDETGSIDNIPSTFGNYSIVYNATEDTLDFLYNV